MRVCELVGGPHDGEHLHVQSPALLIKVAPPRYGHHLARQDDPPAVPAAYSYARRDRTNDRLIYTWEGE